MAYAHAQFLAVGVLDPLNIVDLPNLYSKDKSISCAFSRGMEQSFLVNRVEQNTTSALHTLFHWESPFRRQW